MAGGEALDVLTDALAAARLTRLVVSDTLTVSLRARLHQRYPAEGTVLGEVWDVRPDGVGRFEAWRGRRVSVRGVVVPSTGGAYLYVVDEAGAHPIGVLTSCTWCASVWLAFGVVVLRQVAPRLWSPVARVLAVSAVAGWAGGL